MCKLPLAPIGSGLGVNTVTNQSLEVMSVTEVGELMVALGIVPQVEEEFTAVQRSKIYRGLKVGVGVNIWYEIVGEMKFVRVTFTRVSGGLEEPTL